MPARTLGGIIFIFAFLQLIPAQDITKVLQNGTDGYNGCIDSYTYSISMDKNYVDKEEFFIYNCPT